MSASCSEGVAHMVRVKIPGEGGSRCCDNTWRADSEQTVGICFQTQADHKQKNKCIPQIQSMWNIQRRRFFPYVSYKKII